MIGTCKVCDHSRYTSQAGVTSRFCHHSPPTFVAMPNGQGGMNMAGFWPPVDDEERCSQFALPPLIPERERGLKAASSVLAT